MGELQWERGLVRQRPASVASSEGGWKDHSKWRHTRHRKGAGDDQPLCRERIEIPCIFVHAQDCMGGCFDSESGAVGTIKTGGVYGSQDFFGVVEEMRLWRVVRTAQQVKEGIDADNGRGPGNQPLRRYHSRNECSPSFLFPRIQKERLRSFYQEEDFDLFALKISSSGGFTSAGLDPHHPDLVAYYKFDEGQGYVVHDATGHGHDLYIAKQPAQWEVRSSLQSQCDAHSVIQWRLIKSSR